MSEFDWQLFEAMVGNKVEIIGPDDKDRNRAILDLNRRLDHLEKYAIQHAEKPILPVTGKAGDIAFVEAQYRGQKQLHDDLHAKVDEFVKWVEDLRPRCGVPMVSAEAIYAKLRELGLVKED